MTRPHTNRSTAKSSSGTTARPKPSPTRVGCGTPSAVAKCSSSATDISARDASSRKTRQWQRRRTVADDQDQTPTLDQLPPIGWAGSIDREDLVDCGRCGAVVVDGSGPRGRPERWHAAIEGLTVTGVVEIPAWMLPSPIEPRKHVEPLGPSYASEKARRRLTDVLPDAYRTDNSQPLPWPVLVELITERLHTNKVSRGPCDCPNAAHGKHLRVGESVWWPPIHVDPGERAMAIREAIVDPGNFLDRHKTWDPDWERWDYESVEEWGARAVLAVLGIPDPEDQDQPDRPDPVTDQQLMDLLLLVGVTVTPEQIATGTPEQREQAADGAGAGHVAAS